ncbi:MAG: DUF4339 domain-containing protein [Planctomycetota bacterium]|nr:MAG: DUF4339 domain-containing protein [Planctomycetota bacterium]
MEPVFNLFFAVGFGILVALVANARGRNVAIWFFLGLFFSCFALIAILVLPDLKAEAMKDESNQRRIRRMREQLEQERMKNKSFRKHTLSRLDVHDQALGMDSKNAAPPELPSASEQEQAALGLPQPDWFLAAPGGDPEGPLDLSEIRRRIENGDVHERTLVWHESLKDWKTLEQTPLADFL